MATATARGGGVSSGGFSRPTPANGAPSYYLPGSNVPDPRYAQKKTAYDQASDARYKQDQQYTTDRNVFAQNAANNVNFGMSFTDPRTGLHLTYPGNGGGGAGGGGGDLEDFNFESAMRRARGGIAGPLAPAHLPDRVTASSPADSAAAESAEFGRAKDRIGRLGRGSQTALTESFDSRGMGGSRMEGAATSDLLQDLQGQQGEVIRDQSIQNLVRNRQVEDRNYAGDISQRGQDIGFTTTTRGQDSSHEIARHNQLVPLMQLIAANRRRRLY